MKKIPYLLSLFVVLVSCGSDNTVFNVYDLRVEGLKEPLAIDSAVPYFSWKVEADGAFRQSAYEIEVEPGMWKTGKVMSSDQVMIPYEGEEELDDRLQATWRVRVWNKKGKVSEWSEPQRFGIGPLCGLEGEWIGVKLGGGKAPLFRKQFTLDETGCAILYVTSLGYHDVTVNGKPASDAVLQPAVSQLDKRTQIVAYDISELLVAGQNEIVIGAGSGWHKSTVYKKVFYDGPLVKAELAIDGTPVLGTDASWEGAWSGWADLGDWTPHHFEGELIDAGVVQKWSKVEVVEVEGIESSPQMCAPVKKLETLLPESIERRKDGSWLVDFGRIVNAMMEVELPAVPAGSRVKVTYGDYLNPDGTLLEATIGHDVFISAGAPFVFRNRFNHHAMRYMIIEGLKEKPSVRAHRIGDDIDWESSFTSSDDNLNAIYNLVGWSLRNLTFGGYQVDCSTIERMGYGGDGNASAQTTLISADAAPLYLNWLQAWADSQQPDGGLPHTAPNPYTAGGGPYWCSFFVQAAWRSYMSSGDARPIDRFYQSMVDWLDYVDAYTVDGLLKRWLDEEYRGWYLGDWAAPSSLVDVKDQRSVDLVNNCVLLQVYDALEKMALLEEWAADAEGFHDLGEALRARIHEVFWHDGIYASGSQLDMVYPLLTGVVPAELKQQVVNTLKERTESVYGGHLATGLVGIPVITEWAVREGEAEWLSALLHKADYPGYLYMIENGGTGVWEEWDGGRSHLHNCFNGIGSWFYEALGGIRALEPGYRRVLIAPQVPSGLEYVKVEVGTPYGKIITERNGNELTAIIPVGVTAEIGGKKYGNGTVKVNL